jgi:tRNA dimethylallyltransferase
VLVGGSGLYVAAVLDGLDFPGTEPALRARLEAELAAVGPEQLHARLAEVDPGAAADILATNGRRVVRALEVVELTGRPFGSRLPGLGTGEASGGPRWVRVGLTAPRPELDERVEARVDRMWAAGLVDEVRGLVGQGLREGRTASRALGYAQVLRHLDGELDEGAARDATVAATRRFVRRQEAWFGRDQAIRWLPYDSADLGSQVERLLPAG